ncbi:hypothetical protein IW261DRAFT_1498065 [Armillaria novae-zelandiae]|uniref:Uncharacterized protein n=1 Tax=Armillaria novae-zelandiae TaxID=153914 RepID=A0AA39U556_9AGAR|nr:hypothetical protein IW261DRAFT_1498065 [Armillaria novae-zelandiae]
MISLSLLAFSFSTSSFSFAISFLCFWIARDFLSRTCLFRTRIIDCSFSSTLSTNDCRTSLVSGDISEAIDGR